MKTRTVEYYRLWPGNQGDSGTWDTGFIKIPYATPEDKIHDAIVIAVNELEWRDEPPIIVGLYCYGEEEDTSDNEEPE